MRTEGVPGREAGVRAFAWTIPGLLVLWLAGVGTGPSLAADGPTFRVESARAEPVQGPLLEIGPDWSLRIDGTPATRVRGQDLIAARRTGTRLPPFPLDSHLILANGDRVPCSVLGFAGQKLQVRFREETTPVPLAAVRAIWLAPPGGNQGEDAERLARGLATEKRRRDVLILRNGDQMEGLLTGLDDKAVRLEVGSKQVDIERGRVAVLALNTELLLPARAPSPVARVVLRDGGRWTLAAAAWSPGGPVLAQSVFKFRVPLPLEDIVALTVGQGAAEYLSEIKAKKTEVHSYGSEVWPVVADGNVDGLDLRLGEDVYDRGIGVHSETRLSYDLGGRYSRFEALVGLDPRSGRKGSVRIGVLVDGKDRGGLEKEDLTLAKGPVRLSVDLKGVRELTLVVGFGEGGPVQDHVNWADARLIRQSDR